MRLFSLFVGATLATLGIAAQGAEIRVIASPALSTAIKTIGPKFERSSGHRLDIQYGLEAAQRDRIRAGEFDVAIVPANTLDAAIADGKIVADTRTAVARLNLGVGVRAGGAKPNLASVEAFKRALVAAKTITYVVDEATGRHIAQQFERLGIADAMKAKTRPQKSVPLVWQTVARGDAALGFGFMSNLLAAPGVELAGPFPSEMQYSVALVAGIGASARQADAARNFVKFLLAPETTAILRASGLGRDAP